MADKSLLIGDDAADLLLSYSVLIAQLKSGDEITLHAIGADGDEVEAGFLLNSGTVMVIETSTSMLPEPDNASSMAYMREQLDRYSPTNETPSPFDTLGREE